MRTRLPVAPTVVAILLVGCVQPPTTNVAPRPPMEVAASVGRTWDAVIDLFADRNIPIATMERVSGFIATQTLSVGREGVEWADCGSVMSTPVVPDHAVYNVRVLGDSSQSTVRVTTRWTQSSKSDLSPECPSRGVWETDFEKAVKARAEGKSVGQR